MNKGWLKISLAKGQTQTIYSSLRRPQELEAPRNFIFLLTLNKIRPKKKKLKLRSRKSQSELS
jgi:hypothetical protein